MVCVTMAAEGDSPFNCTVQRGFADSGIAFYWLFVLPGVTMTQLPCSSEGIKPPCIMITTAVSRSNYHLSMLTMAFAEKPLILKDLACAHAVRVPRIDVELSLASLVLWWDNIFGSAADLLRSGCVLEPLPEKWQKRSPLPAVSILLFGDRVFLAAAVQLPRLFSSSPVSQRVCNVKW
ncbi:hypothetical protein CEXT_441601 [Caerostris extrusa]|uniref:Uncharacterized protein n=1 Tax=Caerostris extrusa TaxID=172846 RepID=A0AAV4X6K2_CAEEX|nr:hypothetical protein CEXT_441601 [Caerostris extrusa]